MSALRLQLRLPALRLSTRYISTTPRTLTSAGYGDPQDEKIENNTPRPQPSSSTDPQPGGQGKGTGETSGTTDPEVKVNKGETGSAGGKKGSGGSEKAPSGQETRETKKVGESPKTQESADGTGPIGG